MAINVCCPTCWKWSELGKLMTCKRCGTPLILADGRRADEVGESMAGSDVEVEPKPPAVDLEPVGWSIRVR
jgi:hypothetical protein